MTHAPPPHATGLAALPWDFALILLFLAVVVPWRGRARMQRLLALPEVSSLDRLALYAATIAVQWILAGLVLWRAAARGLSPPELAIAVPDAQTALLTGAALAAFLGGAQFFSLRHLARLPAHRQGFLGVLARKVLPRNAVEALAFFALAVTVGFCEEIIYRGFVFTVLARAAGDVAAAGVAGSALLFGIAHLYQGRRGVVSTFIAGLAFALSRVISGSLAPAIIAHALADLAAGLAAPRLLVSEEGKSGP